MEINISQLEEAVKLFYRSEASQQAAAHEWLTQVQCSPQAWSFAWELMHPDKICEVQFFGATTLHSKLLKYWHEIPANMHEELKSKLLEAIITFGSGPKLVLNRLCIALSAFIVHMLKDWPTAIEDVVNTFQNQQLPNLNQSTQIWIMMEVLCGIPEEESSIYKSHQRATVRHEINRRSNFVIDVIQRYIQTKCENNLEKEDMATLLRGAKCAGVWLKNGAFPLTECQFLATSLLKLINKCYWNSSENDGCMSADENELSEACLETLLAMMIQPDAHRYSNSALDYMKMFLDSLSSITKAEWKENNSNEDIAVGIYSLFIASIESHSKILLNGVIAESAEHKELYMRLVNEILHCTEKPGIYPVEESCSSLAMGFWFMLQDKVRSIENEENKEKSIALIKPLYSHLARILVLKAQPPNELAIDRWCQDDLETFRCYRQDIADTLMYCCEVLGNDILLILSSILDEACGAIQTDIKEWPKIEACIYAFHAIAESINYSEDKYIPKLMQILIEIPYSKLNEKLLGTALEAIGSYCEWFKVNPSYLPSAIELLVKGLNSSMASQATLGLKDLTRECQIQLKIYAVPLLDACQLTLVNGKLRNSESVRLMFSVGKLMSMLPPDKIPLYLDTMVSPCFEEIQLFIQSGNTSESSKIRTVFRLNMISTLFSSLNTNAVQESVNDSVLDPQMQPVLLVMQKTMPIFRQIGELWIKEASIIEALCSSLKYALINLMNDFKPMLPDLCCLIISVLAQKCCPPAIELGKTCILMFSKDEELKNIMQQLFIEINSYNFRLFEQTPSNAFSDISDIIESFYNFNAQIVKKIPSIYFDTNIDCVKSIVFGLKAMSLPEVGSSKNSTHFIAHFIMQSRQFANMMQAVLDKGEDIVRMTLMCISEISPRTQVDVFADIFLAMNKKYPSELILWLKMLEVEQFLSNAASISDKEMFMKAILKEKVNKRLIQGHIREFSAKCRGLVEKNINL